MRSGDYVAMLQVIFVKKIIHCVRDKHACDISFSFFTHLIFFNATHFSTVATQRNIQLSYIWNICILKTNLSIK